MSDTPTDIPADIPAPQTPIEQEAPVAAVLTLTVGALVADEHDRRGIYLGKDADGADLVSWLPEATATGLELDVLA